MTKKLLDPTMDSDARHRKRILKPVVEKKRRDRINQSLAELRSLLLKHTSDPRLQNPKIEKAEILDLAVEYLQRWTEEGKPENEIQIKTHVPVVRLHPSESSLPSLTLQNAGFQQCMAQVGSYMHKIPPAQRTSLMEGLKRHTDTQTQQQQQKPDSLDAGCAMDSVCTPDSKEDTSKFLFSSHSPFQPQSCSTPCHDYLTPPSSPWFSPSFSTYATSPPFPSFTSHFTFPPSLSPPSSNTSFYSFSPTGPHHTGPAGPHFPSPTAPRTSPHLTLRDGSQPNSSSSTWRPWS